MRAVNAGIRSSMSIISTTRSILVRGISLRRTRMMMPNSPYPPIASRKRLAFSVRLHVLNSPSPSISVNDSTSAMIERSASPRP